MGTFPVSPYVNFNINFGLIRLLWNSVAQDQLVILWELLRNH